MCICACALCVCVKCIFFLYLRLFICIMAHMCAISLFLHMYLGRRECLFVFFCVFVYVCVCVWICVCLCVSVYVCAEEGSKHDLNSWLSRREGSCVFHFLGQGRLCLARNL